MLRLAKTLGVRSVWVVDHVVGFFPQSVWDPTVTWLARGGGSPDAFYEWQVLAGRLSRPAGQIQLGVAVTEPIRRHPVVLAQAALTLSHMTRRPPILGIGSGEAENVVPLGLPFDRPVARLEEALAVIRRVLDEPGPHEFEGEFFSLEGARVDLLPGAGGKPKVWVGAHGPRMLELTGRYGDGWLPAVPMTPHAYAQRLSAVRRAAGDAGREPSAIVPAMNVQFLVGSHPGEIADQLRHPAIRFLALLAPDRSWQEHGMTHPLGRRFGGMAQFDPHAYRTEQIRDAIEAVPVDLLEHMLIAGTPDEVVDRVGRLVDAGLRHVILSPLSPLVSRRALARTARALPGIVRGIRTLRP